MGAPERSRQPAIFDLVFLVWSMSQPLLFHRRLLNSDGDLARNLRVGETILQEGRLPAVERFSFPSAGEAVVSFEWLSQVSFAVVNRVGGLPGVAIFAGLIIGLTYALVARFLLRRGVDPLLTYLTVMAASILGAPHWVARPHLFTFLGVALLLPLLESSSARSLWRFAALFLVWACLHGGYLFGLIVIGLYLAGALLDYHRTRRTGADPAEPRARARHLGAALAVALIATCVTPLGLELPRHLLLALGSSGMVNNTAEYLSPDFHDATGLLFLVAILGSVALLALSRTPPAPARLLTVVATLAFGLIARRNITLYGITALPLLALHLDPEWRRLPESKIRAAFAHDEPTRRPGVWSLAGTGLLVVLLLSHGRIGGWQAIPRDFDRRDFPVQVVSRARAAGLDGRLFNEFVWGGYLIWAWPEQRVFIDGGHYGDRMVSHYSRISFRTKGWRRALDDWGISLVLVPTTSSLAHELAPEPAWEVWACDEVAVLLRRVQSGALQASGAVVPGRSPASCPRDE